MSASAGTHAGASFPETPQRRAGCSAGRWRDRRRSADARSAMARRDVVSHRDAVSNGRRAFIRSTSMPPRSMPAANSARMADHAPAPPSSRFERTAPNTRKAGERDEVPEPELRDDSPQPGPRPELAPTVDEIGEERRPFAPAIEHGSVYARQEERADPEARRVRRDRPARARHDDEHTGDRRPRDAADRHRQPAQRIRLLEALRSNDLRNDSSDAGMKKGRCSAPHRLEDDQLPELRVPRQEQHCHYALRGEPQPVRGHHQPAARRTIGNDAAGEQQRHQGNGAGCQYVPEIRHRAGHRAPRRTARPARSGRRAATPRTRGRDA